jgi:ribosomal protein S18 acetylase RimI-like enzyme
MNAKIDRLASDDGEVAHAIATLYCEVWREPPWNEDFWTTEGVLKDIEREMQRSGARCFHATAKGSVVGFTWGYQVTGEDLAVISGNPNLLRCLPEGSSCFYIDELAVQKESRKHGVGRRLTEALMRAAFEVGVTVLLLRTDEKAFAARMFYRDLGFKELSVRDSKYPGRTYWMKQAL